MGFKDIKTDGLSKELIEKERKELLDRYFGTVSFGADSIKGQFERFEELKSSYLDSIQSNFCEFFQSFGWSIDKQPDTLVARANKNDNVLLSMYSYEIYFNITDSHLKYKFQVLSDFQEIGYYIKSRNKFVDRYERRGGMPIDLERQNEELKEMRIIINENLKLNDNYNFRVFFAKENDEISGEYKNIKEFLDKVSDKYF